MAITSIGIGSGIDIEGLITELITTEQAPQTLLLDSKEADVTSEITGISLFKSALKTFESSLSTFSDITTFTDRKATSADTSVFTATADSTAVSGNYDVEVVTLAQEQKLISTAFDTAATVVGSGVMTISTDGGSSSFNVTITAGTNDTVAGIRDAINDSTLNTGVTATTINVDDGSGGTDVKLVITADELGTDNIIEITTDDDDLNDTDTSGLSQLVYDLPGTTNMTELQAAVDGQIKIEGQTLTNKAGNSYSSAITGVTITAIKADPNNSDNLAVTLDNTSVSTEITNFANAFNAMMDTFNSLTSYNSDTGATGLLFGDTSLRTIKAAVLKTVTSAVTGLTNNTYSSLSQIGVHLNEDSKLVVTQSELTAALNKSFDDPGKIIATGTTGIAAQLESIIDNYTLSTTGLLDKKTDGLNDILDNIKADREDLAAHFAIYEDTLRSKFTAMDIMLAGLEVQGNYISQLNTAFLNMLGSK